MAEKLEIVIGARDQFSGTFDKLKSSLPSLKTLAVGAGAAIAGTGAALFALTKSTAEAHDKVGKFASRIGISTEALSAYHHVAELSGVSNQTLDMGFQRMTRRVAEAAVGVGVARGALEELGIPIESIKQLEPDKQFEKITEAMSGVENQSDRARLAMQFFDSEGVALLQTMTGGAEGLKAMREEAEKFGLVVSEKAARNSAKFKDSLARVRGSLKGVSNAIAEKVMPTITGLANRFADFAANNRDRIVKFAESFLAAMAGIAEKGGYAVAVLVDSWRGLRMVWEVLKIAFAGFTEALLSGIDWMVARLESAMETLNFRGVFDDAIEDIKGFRDANANALNAIVELGQTSKDNLDEIIGDGSAVSRVAEIGDKIRGAIIAIRETADEGMGGEVTEAEPPGIYPFSTKNVEVTADNMARLQEMYNEHFLTEGERLDVWYAAEQEKYKTNAEALEKLRMIYEKRRQKLADKELKGKEKEKKAEFGMNDKFQKDVESMSRVFGEKGVWIAKAASIPKAWTSIYTGAAKALELPFPANIAAAASVIAYGAKFVGNIIGQSFGGAAHGGLEDVPRESTYLLAKGERVLSPSQNKDLTDFLESGGSGVAIENFNLEIYAPEPLQDMDKNSWVDMVEDFILPAMRRLSEAGVTV